MPGCRSCLRGALHHLISGVFARATSSLVSAFVSKRSLILDLMSNSKNQHMLFMINLCCMLVNCASVNDLCVNLHVLNQESLHNIPLSDVHDELKEGSVGGKGAGPISSARRAVRPPQGATQPCNTPNPEGLNCINPQDIQSLGQF